jgi:hypothetical protein
VIDPKKAVSWALKAVYEKPDKLLPGEGLSTEDMQMLAEAENLVLAAGQPLSPTEGATIEHTTVHLNYTKSAEFQLFHHRSSNYLSSTLWEKTRLTPQPPGEPDNFLSLLKDRRLQGETRTSRESPDLLWGVP